MIAFPDHSQGTLLLVVLAVVLAIALVVFLMVVRTSRGERRKREQAMPAARVVRTR